MGNATLKDNELFQCLSDTKAPKGALGASVGLHAVLLSFLVLLPLVAPQALRVNYRAIVLVPSPSEPRQTEPVRLKPPPPLPLPRPVKQEPQLVVESVPPAPAPPPKIVAREPEPRVMQPVPQPSAPAAPASIAPSLVNPKAAPLPAPPPPPIVTNVFSGLAAPSATSAPSRSVEDSGFAGAARDGSAAAKNDTVSTAGFGDVSGSRDRGRSGKGGGVGVVGGFDNGVPGGARSGGNRGTVASGGFASAASAPKAPAAASQKVAEQANNEKPVEIVLKPRPDYTDEARKMRIEGEVLLRVLFSSSGEARVLDVIQGLGHGLNETAIRAAEHIRFKPAERGGQAVDSTAIVHIVFQLAY